MKISRETTIGDVISLYSQTAEVFIRYGLRCIGCHAMGAETIEEGCRGHDLDDEKIDALIDELNKEAGKTGKKKK